MIIGVDRIKIGIIAGTHDNLPNIEKVVETFNKGNIDLLFHAVDFVSPFTARGFKKIQCLFTGVFGNNDRDRLFF